MKKRMLIRSGVAVWLVNMVSLTPAAGEAPQTITLPPPQTEGGMPLLQALKERSSIREYAPDTVPLPVLSTLLWSACGVNRPNSGKRTAPSARNWQEIDIYVATAEGLYRYDAKPHSLILVLAQDIRAKTGAQPFVKEAPINLIYVADTSRIDAASTEEKIFYSAVDTGFISENVYLFCASEGLATVTRRWIDIPELARTMNLRPDQKITLSQTVGYAKK